jgi:hypothetical protein
MSGMAGNHTGSSQGRQTYVVYVCPDCGEQITDGLEYDTERGYTRGHYHDPPDGWLDEAGNNPQGTGEDPWFDAIEIRTVSLDAVVEALRSRHSAVINATANAVLREFSSSVGEAPKGNEG